MIRITATLSLLVLLASASTEAQTIAITRGGSRPVRPGPVDNFTGSVRVEMLFEAVDPSHASGGSVTFDPGARTAWHVTSARPDPDRDSRHGARPAMGRSGRRDSGR